MAIDLTGLPDSGASTGVDLDGLPDTHADTLKGSYRQNTDDPATYAREQKLSKATGLPASAIRGNVNEAERAANEPNWGELEKSAPVTVRNLAKDAELFKIAKNDLDSLSTLERMSSLFTKGYYTSQAGAEISSAAELSQKGQKSISPTYQTRDIYGRKGPSYDVNYYNPAQFVKRQSQADKLIGEAVSNLQEAARIPDSPVLKRITEAKTAMDAAAAFITEPVTATTDVIASSGYAMIETAAYGMAGGVVGGKAGYTAGTFVGSYNINFNAKFLESLADQGVNLGDEEAIRNALQNPTIVREAGDKAFRYAAPIAAFDAAAARIAGARLSPSMPKNVLYQTGVQMASGGLGEAAGQWWSEGELSPGEILLETVAEIPGGVIDLVGANAKAHLSRLTKAARSKAMRNRLGEMVDISNASELKKLDPEKFAALVDKMVGEDAESVHLSSDDAAVFFQSNPEALAVVRDKLPEVAANVQEAMETGGDVVIPIKDYATYLAEYHPAIAEKIRIGADSISLAEENELKGEANDAFKRDADDIVRQRDEADNAEQVRQAVKDEIVATGRFTGEAADKYAALHGAFATSVGERLGISPAEVYEQYGLRVRVPPPAAEPSPPPGEAVAAGGTLLEQEAAQALQPETLLPEAPAGAAIDPAEAWSETAAVMAQEQGLSPEQAAEVAPQPDADPLTGLYTDRELLPAIERAKQSGEAYTYVESDLFNLGGINKALGSNVKANAVLKEVGDAYAKAFGDSVVFRRGGGRFSAIVPEGFDVGAALDELNATVQQIAEKHDLTGIPAARAPGVTGIGLYSGQVSVAPDADIGQIIGGAQQQIVEAQPQEGGDVNRKQAGETWLATFAGQAGRIAASAARADREAQGAVGEKQGRDVRQVSLERTRKRPRVNAGRFAQPDAHRQETYAAKSDKLGLSPEQRRAFYPKTNRDPLTGWFTDRDRAPTVQRAQELFDSEGIDSAYVSVDISNLGGMNDILGRDVADTVFRNMSEIVAEAAHAIPNVDVVPFRHGGDEISLLIVGADDKTAQAAMDKAAAEVQRYVRTIGIHDLPHSKAPDDRSRAGTGIYVGIAPIEKKQTASAEELFDFADSLVEDAKKRPRPSTFFQQRRAAIKFYQGEEQAEKPDVDTVYAWAKEVRGRLGLETFSVYPSGRNDLKLNLLVVGKADQKQGKGTAAMNELTAYADRHGFRLLLSPALPDDRKGTTSRARLVKFYKRFGFYENKGRNKDFAISESMIRDPQQKSFSQQQRGAIQFAEDITKDPSIIHLFEKADLSTIIHESGHFFFEVMADLASKEGAPAQISADIQTLMDWYGVKDLETWNALDTESQRQHHEKFARGFEAYLFEGKAPSIELQNLFQQFRSWLVTVYRSLRALNVELTDEVRGVMGRMLATEDQIQAAEVVHNYRPLFESAEQAGMTKAEWAEYIAGDTQARSEAREDLDTKSMKDMKWLSNAKSKIIKELQREASKTRKSVRAEVAPQVESEPVYQAIRFFKKGEMVGPDGEDIKVTEGNKLNKEAVEALFPPNELGAIDLKKLSGMMTKDGMDIDVAGQIFGFENGDQMVKAILNAPALNEAIESRTDRVMLERFGDITTPEAIEQAANEAVHNEARARFVATELRALARQTGGKAVLIKAAKEYAAEKTASKKVRDAIKSFQYSAAEARAAREAENALKKNDVAKAAAHKRAQLLNMYMFKAAEEARKEVDKIVNYMKKFESKNVRKKLRGEMAVQIDALLERFDFRKSARTLERQPLGEFVIDEAERLNAIVPDLSPIATNESYRKHYKDLTMEELRGLRDTMKQLEHMARRENNMYLERRAMDFETEKQAILNELKDANPEAFNEDGLPKQYRKDREPLLKEMAGKFKSKFDAEFLNVENLLDIMTAGKGNQIFDSLFGRLSEAADAQTRMMKNLAEFLKPATSAYSLKERLAFSMASSRVFVPEVGEYFTRDKRIAVALFYGSMDGRQRLSDGNGYSDFQVQSILKTLDDKDLDFIEALWQMSDEKIWPELKALDERTKGVAAKKIEPASYSIGGRVMRGGYVPLVYDGDLSTRAFDLNSDNAIDELRGGTAAQAVTRQSASKQRLKEVKRALDLSLSAIAYKINETVHDVTHREAVTDTYRLLQSGRISNAMRTISGPDVYNALLTKVRETAVKPVVPRGIVERSLWYLRRNTMINMMGASFNTVAINVLGASPAIRRVGPAGFIRAVNKIASFKGKEHYKWVLEKSPYMKERIDGFDRDLSAEVNRFTGKAGIGPDMGTWLAGLSVMDRMITIPAWMAAYEQSMMESGNDEATAVQYADRVIRQTQGSGRIIDLAKVTGGVGPAGEFKRIITMFYNFFSAQLGMMVRDQRLAAKDWNAGRRAKAVMQFTLTTLAVVVIPATLEAIARGNCGDDPDAEDYLYCAGRSSGLFISSMFPILRDMVPYAWHQFDPETKAFGVRLSPIESAMETVARSFGSIRDVVSGEGDEKDVKTIMKALGYGLGLPGFQAARTLDGFQALMDGETDNPAVLLTGVPK